jgi:hypothetical protein
MSSSAAIWCPLMATAQPAAATRRNARPIPLDIDRREAEQRLIGEQHRWRSHEGNRDLGTPRLATGKRVR